VSQDSAQRGNDCADRAAGPLALETALAQLLAAAAPVAERESVLTDQALRRVLAASVVSPTPIPGWDNSAMDGYALRTADVAEPGRRLQVGQRISAGATGVALAPGTAARIFTGAPVPPGADAVAVQEACEQSGDWVQVNAAVRAGDNIRRAGEEIAAGQEVLSAGTRLAPQHLALAAAVGAAELPVYRRVRVAIFSTGDELVMPGQPLAPGQIYNSNRFQLRALLETIGCEVLDLGIVADRRQDTIEALTRGASAADLILASGGVSVGEEDHVKPAIEQLGRLELWRLAIRPGKPLAFGHVGGTPVIGSPGNPVALFIVFSLLVRPFILRRQGVCGDVMPSPIWGEAGFDWPRPDKRREFVRARLERQPSGAPRVHVYSSRSSAMLSSLVWAEGLAVIPEGQALAAGDPVQYIPFSELLA